METLFYLYTIVVMLACVATGAMALAAYFVSRKQRFFWSIIFFFSYFFDLVLIFQNEYFHQNITYQLSDFYSIQSPLIKAGLALIALESLWLIVCDYLNEKRLALHIVPSISYCILTSLVLLLLPDGAVKQYAFYSVRQIFLLWTVVYCIIRYLKTKNEIERLDLKRHQVLFFISIILICCITLEDSFFILIWQPASTSEAILPLYISERNISENLLTLAFAFYNLRAAAQMLRLRFNEPPVAETTQTMNHAHELLPVYCQRHNISHREQEILSLILEGKDNRRIAHELQLALGTVKAHTHNILHKTGCKRRADLIRSFWNSD